MRGARHAWLFTSGNFGLVPDSHLPGYGYDDYLRPFVDTVVLSELLTRYVGEEAAPTHIATSPSTMTSTISICIRSTASVSQIAMSFALPA